MTDELFVDSSYLIALAVLDDDIHRAARRFADDLPPSQRFVTSHGVFAETLAHISRASAQSRIELVEQFQRMEANPLYAIVTHDASLVRAALDLYAGEFAYSTFSLQDCVAIQIMREYGIESILTADREFSRAGFTPLLRGYID